MENRKLHDCCNDDSNLIITEHTLTTVVDAHNNTKAADLTVKQCKVCGSRHHELAIDPIDIVAELKN